MLVGFNIGLLIKCTLNGKGIRDYPIYKTKLAKKLRTCLS